jgi:aryl sulfotransferase
MTDAIAWPVKSREIQTWAMDSTYWDDFKFRDDDIVISTYGKAGTTWVQQIIAQFIFNGETEDMPIADMSPWHDFRLPPMAYRDDIEAQDHRRFVKTQLPMDALVYASKAKYIYIARDGRDVVWSLYNHHYYMSDMVYDGLNALPDFGPVIGRPETDDLSKYFLDWLHREGYPWWPFWENITSWWAIRDLPNIQVLHYQNLIDDKEDEMRKMAAFLDFTIDETKWAKMDLHTSFGYMKKNAALSTPLAGAAFDGGAEVFINKGTNNRWRDTLTQDDIDAYEARALDEPGAECAHWLATGQYLS